VSDEKVIAVIEITGIADTFQQEFNELEKALALPNEKEKGAVAICACVFPLWMTSSTA
jgi:hypothetical protein